jgi:hypothetical protein
MDKITRRVITNPTTLRIRTLIASKKGARSMDLEVARILGISRSVAGRKLRGAGGWKPNQIRDIAAAYGVSSSALLDEKPDPNLSRIDISVRPECLTPLSLPVYQENTGENTKAKAVTVDLPHDSATILLDTSDLAPEIPQGRYVIITREGKPRHGDPVYVQYKAGGHDFGTLLITASRLMLMKAGKPPVPLRRSDVVLYTIIGTVRKR